MRAGGDAVEEGFAVRHGRGRGMLEGGEEGGMPEGRCLGHETFATGRVEVEKD